MAGHVAINEVVVHGWDIAAATRNDYACETELAQAAYAFVQSAVGQNPDGSPGLFGPSVRVPDSAPLLDRLIGLTGLDPAWQPAEERRWCHAPGQVGPHVRPGGPTAPISGPSRSLS